MNATEDGGEAERAMPSDWFEKHRERPRRPAGSSRRRDGVKPELPHIVAWVSACIGLIIMFAACGLIIVGLNQGSPMLDSWLDFPRQTQYPR